LPIPGGAECNRSANIEMVLDTWEYVEGSKTSPPQEDSPDFADWSNGNCAACCRIWLALSDKVQDCNSGV